MIDLKRELKDIILRGTSYSGNKKSGVKSLSASSLSMEMLPLWLKYKYGYDDAKKIELNTLGTLVHSGLEQIFESQDGYQVEAKGSKEMNGWDVTGSVDIFNKDKNIIIDWKVSDPNRIRKDLIKEGKNHQYALQLAVYKWLIGDDDTVCMIGTFNRQQSYYKKSTKAVPVSRDVFELFEVNVHSNSEIEMIIASVVEELEKAISSDEPPEQCKNLRWSRAYAQAKPIGCIRYCNVSDSCPHNRFKQDSENLKILLGL